MSGTDASSALPGSDALLNFVEVSLGDDADAIAAARQAVVDALGEPAMVDAAGVIANFQRMVRIADSTGIPLDPPVAMMTQDIRTELGINNYGSADNTPALGWLQGLIGRLIAPFAPAILSRLFRPKS